MISLYKTEPLRRTSQKELERCKRHISNNKVNQRLIVRNDNGQKTEASRRKLISELVDNPIGYAKHMPWLNS